MNATTDAPPKASIRAGLHFAREAPIIGSDNADGLAAISSEVLHMKTETLICVVDCADSVRKEVTRFLQPEKYPIESFDSAQSFLNRKTHVGPCCLVVELRAPDLHGLNLQQMLSQNRRTEQIIFISGLGDIPMCAQAFKGGAVDFLTKPLEENRLLEAVHEGLLRSNQLFRLRREGQEAQALLNQLTPREREVLGFVIAGQLNKVIASVLGTTEKTIKKHRAHLMQKLGFSSVAELVHFSLQFGLKPACPYGSKVPYTSMS
jgi:FixJ family two-component response regulator